MENELHDYKVTLKPGLGGPFVFEATSSHKARLMALAEYRRNITIVDQLPLDQVVEKDVEDLGPVGTRPIKNFL